MSRCYSARVQIYYYFRCWRQTVAARFCRVLSKIRRCIHEVRISCAKQVELPALSKERSIVQHLGYGDEWHNQLSPRVFWAITVDMRLSLVFGPGIMWLVWERCMREDEAINPSAQRSTPANYTRGEMKHSYLFPSQGDIRVTYHDSYVQKLATLACKELPLGPSARRVRALISLTVGSYPTLTDVVRA